jgi:hypothetical protein
VTERTAVRELARRQAARRYAVDFDRHSEEEQMARLSGDFDRAEQEHQAARIALRAWLAEEHDA